MVSISQVQAAGDASPAAPPARRWASLLVACLGVMMVFVNASATLSALPYIQDDLHVSGSTLVWIPSAFTLAVVSLVMSAGTFGELYGRRLTYFVGIVLVVAGSATAFLAPDAGVLIAGQAISGVGAAAALPTGLAIVATNFHDPHERTGAISIWASTAGLGLAIGPIVAGLLLDHFSWHAVYATNVVLGFLAAVLTMILVAESKQPGRRLDPAGVVLGSLTIAAATYAIIEGGASGYGEPPIAAAYIVAVVGLALFVRVELRHHDPMLELRLFRSASFTAVMLIAASVMFGFVGIALLSVLYLERVAGLGALETGVRLMPMMASYVIVSAFAARVLRAAGLTVTLTAGLVLMGAGSLTLLWVGATSGYATMWPGLLLVGIGSALLVAPTTTAAVNSVPPTQAGMASATVNMFRQLGSMLGPSVLGTIAATQFPNRLVEELTRADVPADTASRLAAAVSQGRTQDIPESFAATVGSPIHEALTSALHLGWLVGGVVLLGMAIAAALFVRHRHPAR
jgi:EmrB/QacA subfamily drug resistance transporter